LVKAARFLISSEIFQQLTERSILMKRTLVVAVLAITASSLAFGQTKDRSNKKSGNVEQTLMQIEQELLDALLKGDTSAAQRYTADTYIFTGPDGTVMDKGRSIADLKSGDLKIESSKLDDMKVQAYGDTAVVTYRSTDKGNYKGSDLSGQYRWTDVFVKRNGRWQIVAGQGTRIAQQ
jgi:ketosteroid isomerase-like protein